MSLPDSYPGHRLRSGAQVDGRPLVLRHWRVTTPDPDIALRIAALYGGRPQRWSTSGPDVWEVYTDASELEVLLADPGALEARMLLWGRAGLLRDDGPLTRDLDLVQARRAARAGYGAAPFIILDVTLARAPGLGTFRFCSGAWDWATGVLDLQARLAAAEARPIPARLALETVDLSAPAGVPRCYTRPALELLGSGGSAR